MINKIPLPTYYVHNKFEFFDAIKNHTLSQLVSSEKDHPSITSLDWNLSHDFNRPWVRYFLPFLTYNLINTSKILGYSGIELNNIWFQTYSENSHHGWHIHTDHYTGVVYLDYPEDAPPTQLIIEDKIIDIKAKEGDIITFPSFVTHRSPANFSTKNKTIISFNYLFNLDPYDFPE